MPKRITAFALVALLLVSVPAGAQYFGRNKVQYDRFSFEILATPHFDLYFYPAERDAAQIAGRLAERWYARLSTTLDFKFSRRQPIILYASHSHFAQTAVLPGAIPEGVGGFTDHQAGRVVLPFGAGLADTDHVLGHEIVHAFQREILKKHGRSLAMVPLWFSEGMAEYLSIGPIDTNTRMWLRDSVDADRLPTIAQLDDPRYFPYRFGQALWTFLADRYGTRVLADALVARARGGAGGRLQAATHRPVNELSREWHEWVHAQIDRGARAVSADRPPALISAANNGGRLNLGPALSPDGRLLVFLSERDELSMDLFLADAETGAVIRKLMNTAADSHVDSLEFLESAGAWDADGRRFAIATLRDGRPVLTILNMPSGTVERELSVPQVDQIFSPTFSPEGSRVVVAGMKGGFTDLYLVDVGSGAVDALTGDAASDLEPAWSPDGRQVAFATDRFSSAPGALTFGPYQLASFDLATHQIALLGGLPGGKNIDPHWTPDGERLMFVSDADGTSNVYQLVLKTGVVTRVTDVRGGVTGVTALSPAISVQANPPRLAFSEYVRGGYEIRTMSIAPEDAARPAVATEVASRVLVSAIGVLPAAESHLADAFPVRPYVPSLSLVSVGQPYMSAGGGAFGSFLRAGISLGLDDMLGEQQLQTAVQVGKNASDFAVQGTYVNRRSRWNWGVIAAQVPSLTGAVQTDTAVTSNAGERTIVRDSTLFQQVHRQVSGLVMYPFSRALRFETTFGVDAVRFERQTTTSTYSAITGNRLAESRSSAAAASPATIAETSAALVYDSAIMGASGPILGQRYRVAIAPAFGDVSVMTAVADYRRYVMPVRPFTIAFRAEHVGRYGAGVSDPRLLPLVWTLRDLVRGFDADNTMLRTSRFDVANVELRLPVIGGLGRRVRSSALPIDALAFVDAGRFRTPELSQSPSRNLASAGAGMRINAAGFIFEFDAVRPLAGGGSHGWRFGVNFSPGF